MMRRATATKLFPEKREQYLLMHKNAWPDVCRIMAEHHHTNHSVFILGDYLFQYFEYTGENFDADMAEMRAIPVMQEWWKLCAECVKTIYEGCNGEWQPMNEIFHNN